MPTKKKAVKAKTGPKPLFGEAMVKFTIRLPTSVVDAYKAEGRFHQDRMRKAIIDAAPTPLTGTDK